MKAKQLLMVLTLGVIASLLLAACQTEKIVETVVVTEIVEVQGTPQVIEKVIVVTPSAAAETPAPPTPTLAPDEPTATEAPTPAPTQVTRRGGWLDTLVIVEEPNDEAGVSRIKAGELDAHVFSWDDPELFASVQTDADLNYTTFVGSSNELTFNPSGPTFETTGKLNPFSVAKIREAMNWLIDRDYITEEIMGGLGLPRFFPIVVGFPDYARYIDKVRELEAYYAYNPEKGQAVINEEMQKLGATLVDGQWQFNGEPVEIIFVIRTEDERLETGDYIANQLENIGFTVTRSYKTAAEAAPLWRQSNPADGLWHLYTGGWITTQIVRDQGSNFEFYHTNRGLTSPLWQAYVVSPEYDEICTRLSNNLFDTLAERDELFRRALELSMQEGARFWLADGLSFSPYKPDLSVVADLSGGIQGADLWAYTLQWRGMEGGAMTLANASILTENWNPLGGSNQVFDQMIMKATGDQAVLADPYTGLYWPQRIERAEVFAVEGLPIASTYDWMQLEFVPEIEVPADAWVDWNASEQRFITVGEAYTETVTAKTKLVVYFPQNLYDILWHDGSQFSLGDIVLSLILNWDPGKVESAIYDESQVPGLQAFQSHFKGVRLVQENPLIIEIYDDAYSLDAETMVANYGAWLFPFYAFGQGAWHTLGIGILADTNGELAFTQSKADLLEIDSINMIGGPSLEILARYMEQAAAESYLPYASVLSQYITPEEVEQRWANLQEWYRRHTHFWVGTGPYYMDKVFPVEGTVLLKHNAQFIDLADKWTRFGEPQIAEVFLNGPGSIQIGEEAAFEVQVTFAEAPYPVADIDQVKYLLFDNDGNLVVVGEAQAVEDGLWVITLTQEQTALLKAGSNKMEVAVVSLKVSLPSFETIEFISE